MCSTTDEWLGRICRAIDELAARSTSADSTVPGAEPGADTMDHPGADSTMNEPDPGTATESSQPTADDTAARLAAIWEMVADADPELARRLPGYLSAAE